MSIDIDIEVEDFGSKADIPATEEAVTEKGDSILVDGVTGLEQHPDIFSFVKGLNELKNKWIHEVGEFSEEFELEGSVRIFFSVREKARKPKSLENLTLEPF